MPITIQPAVLKFKNEQGVYQSADCLSGDPSSIIDDTAGLGDTNKTWSADKTDTEIESIKSAINVSQPTAQNSDVGKFLKLKTIDQNGKPTEFEYGEGGGGGSEHGIPAGGIAGQVLKKTTDTDYDADWEGESGAGSVDPAVIAEKVADWMEENITSDPTVVIDTSLSVQGAAAEAKKTGEAIAEVKSNFDGTIGFFGNVIKPIYQDGWVLVNGNGANASIITSPGTYIYTRSKNFFPVKYGEVYGYCRRKGYNSNGQLVPNTKTSVNNSSKLLLYNSNYEYLESVTQETYNSQTYVYVVSNQNAAYAKYVEYIGNELNSLFSTAETKIAAIQNIYTWAYFGINRSTISNANYFPKLDDGNVRVQDKNTNQKHVNVNSLTGKTIAVIGDSIDTMPGRNAVEITVGADDVGHELKAFITYQDVHGSTGDGYGGSTVIGTIGGITLTDAHVGEELTFTPVEADIGKVVGRPLNQAGTARETWWMLLENEFGCKVNPVAWSGSGLTSYLRTDAYKTSPAQHEAQIRKCGTRIPGSMTRIAPDYIIITRGINDYSYTNGKAQGLNLEVRNPTIPDTDLIDGVYCYDAGLLLTVKKLRVAYPMSKIIYCPVKLAQRGTSVNGITYKIAATGETILQYVKAGYYMADMLGLIVAPVDKLFNDQNIGYVTPDGTHLDNDGHRMVYEVIKNVLLENDLGNVCMADYAGTQTRYQYTPA